MTFRAEVKMPPPGTRNQNLAAYVTLIVGESLVIHDVKLIRKRDGGYFVAMPNAKITTPCPRCFNKNPIKAAFCLECGKELEPTEGKRNEHGKEKVYSDIVHPIDPKVRQRVNDAVMTAYRIAKAGAVRHDADAIHPLEETP